MGKKAVSLSLLFVRLKSLIRHPAFGVLTILGNGTILGGALALYLLEKPMNVHLTSFLDALWWAVATVTTVGHAEVMPVTPPGKILGILMMIFGTALFCSFTGLFASILLAPDIEGVEKEVQEVERSVRRLEVEFNTDEQTLSRISQDLETALAAIHKLRKPPQTGQKS